MSAEHRPARTTTKPAPSATAAAMRTIDEARRHLDEARTSGDLAERLEEIRTRLQAALATLEESATRGVEAIGEMEATVERRLQDDVAEAERRIRENPLGAVLVAAGVGLLVGLVLRRR